MSPKPSANLEVPAPAHSHQTTKPTTKNVKTKKEVTYKLVSENEADLKAKKISVNSPIGKGLLGKAIGDIAVVETPAAKIEFEIMNISI